MQAIVYISHVPASDFAYIASIKAAGYVVGNSVAWILVAAAHALGSW